jgi:hypothetical protein
MASISFCVSAIAASNAGRKSFTCTRSNAGQPPWGPVHGASSADADDEDDDDDDDDGAAAEEEVTGAFGAGGGGAPAATGDAATTAANTRLFFMEISVRARWRARR